MRSGAVLFLDRRQAARSRRMQAFVTGPGIYAEYVPTRLRRSTREKSKGPGVNRGPDRVCAITRRVRHRSACSRRPVDPRCTWRQGSGAARRRSRPHRPALRACGVGAGPYGRAAVGAPIAKYPPSTHRARAGRFRVARLMPIRRRSASVRPH